jgi:hypothetical protein
MTSPTKCPYEISRCDLPPGVDVSIWTNHEENLIRSPISPFSISFKFNSDFKSEFCARLRQMIQNLGEKP